MEEDDGSELSVDQFGKALYIPRVLCLHNDEDGINANAGSPSSNLNSQSDAYSTFLEKQFDTIKDEPQRPRSP
jgi:hypothetical protein